MSEFSSQTEEEQFFSEPQTIPEFQPQPQNLTTQQRRTITQINSTIQCNGCFHFTVEKKETQNETKHVCRCHDIRCDTCPMCSPFIQGQQYPKSHCPWRCPLCLCVCKKIVKKTRTQKRKRVLQSDGGTDDVPRMSSPQMMQPSWPLTSFIAPANSQFLSYGSTIAQTPTPPNSSATQASQLPVTTSLTTRVPTTETMSSSTATATFLMPIHTKEQCLDVLELCKTLLTGLEPQVKNEIKICVKFISNNLDNVSQFIRSKF
jgi:hypothetical protein